MKRFDFAALRRRSTLAFALVAALAASASAPAQQAPQNIWITLYFNDQGQLVGAEGYGGCGFALYGQWTPNSTTGVYECDGEWPI
jgi:hypothetical protein